ncbi:MucBP domain-containing protein, partial [Pediococcus pentosaceus]|uniref:mucin-binding protein n=1 Tax=Pediococcus pentosaceus TaxID=1255 RepID=UPI0021E6DC46
QSPDIDGYFTLNTSVAGKTVTDPQKQADFSDTVIYYKTDQGVTPDDPKTPDTPVNPSDPDSPDYPDGVDYDDLNADVKETVHYVDENGNELAETYTKTVHYERTAHIKYDKDGNASVTYGDWTADGSFDVVQSPDVDGYFTLNKTVDGKTVTDPQHQADFEENVIYYPTNQDVTPDDPKTPDTPINPSDPDSPDYPDGVDYDDLNADVKETVHYVDENGKELAGSYTKTVHYERTAHVSYDQNGNATVTYSDWSANGSFDAVQSPDIDGYFTLNKTVAGKKVTDPQGQPDFNETVIYYPTSQDVTPDDPKTPDTPVNPSDPDSPDYPDGVDYDDLNADVKETVHYVDEKGNELTETYTKTVHYERTAHVSYDQNGNATVTYSDWSADGSFDAVQSPEIDGYFTLNKSVAGKTVTDPQHQADFEDTVIYYKSNQDVTPDDPKTPDTPVNPSDPDSPDYPDGVDYDDLNADVKETVHYVDENGKELAETYTKTVHYERTAHVSYDQDGNATVTYGDWSADGSFDAVQSPDVDGYFTLNKSVAGKTVTDPQHQADFEDTVIYYKSNQDVTPDDPKTPDTPINPNDPDSPDYPDGVDYDDLNADVKETVHYVDENGKELAETYTKTVHYERTAHVSFDKNGNATVTYSDWSANGSFDAVQNPEIDGYFTLNKSVAGKTVTDPQGQPDFNETVIYYKTNQDVTPDDPKTPDTPVNPSDPDSPDYPDGVDYDDLNADVKETVHYVDENGKQVAETYTKTVHYERTAHVTFDQDGNATVTYSDWSADGSFDAVQSPDVDGYFTLNTSVAGKTVTDPQHQADFEDTVIYYKSSQDVTPDDPKTPDTPVNPSDPDSPDYPDGVDYDDLNADVKETVHYVDENGKELAETYTKTVHYTRTAHVTFDKNGNATVTYSDWSGDSAFDAVQSPDVDGYFTLNTTVAGKTVTDPQHQADFEDTVIYYKSSQDVTPDDPKTPDTPINPSDPDSPDYPDGVDYDDLNADVKETVHYVDENGKELAGTYTKTVHYERTAHVSFDKNGNATVTYSDWSADGSFDAVQSPEIDGYFTLNTTVAGKTVTDPQGQPDFNETVIYYKSSQDVTPDDPKTPDTPINPSDPDSPDYPDGVDYDDLNADVKETVHYVDENGKEIAKTYTKTVHYTRTAHVTFDKNGNATVTYSDWSADGSFDAVQSPDVDGYFTLNTTVAGKTVTDPQHQADFEDTVIYYKSSQDVTPDDPKTPDTPVNPSDPDSPVYPDGVDYDDLNADVKETVHYVGENGKELADTYTKTVHYTRTAHVSFDKNGNATVTYSDWSADGSFDAVQSPDVDGYFTLNTSVAGKTVTDPQHQADFEDTVIYYKSSQNVTPDDPKAPDTPINPSDPNSPVYPDGVDEDDLNQDVTETIHYVDAITGEELADTYTKTVHYTRNATVNYDANGNATVTYSDWTAQDSFGAVDSPDIDGYVADQITVSGREVNATDNDFDITVNYYDNDQHVTPDSPKHNGDKIDPSNPNSPVFPAGVDESDLNKDVTETIHYVDENGNELADTYTKTVHYTRDAHVHYDADGNTTITYGDWVADGSFDAVNSPEIDGYVADQDVIAALDNPIDNVDIVVTYHHAEVAPTPAPEKTNTSS